MERDRPGSIPDQIDTDISRAALCIADLTEKYGAWREKNMYGNIKMGIQRSTFIIDAAGKVAKVWKSVKVDGHDQKVIDALKELL